MTTTDAFTTAARAEAEARYPRDADGFVPPDRWPFKIGAAWGAQWARDHLAAQESTLPAAFRDPEALAHFVIENEWALDSEINPSGRADWHETLHRVCDAWDVDTPEDIVSAIAAAIRLDRSFRTAAQEPTDAECIHVLSVVHTSLGQPTRTDFEWSQAAINRCRDAMVAARAVGRDAR